jgi:hypothetical protein
MKMCWRRRAFTTRGRETTLPNAIKRERASSPRDIAAHKNKGNGLSIVDDASSSINLVGAVFLTTCALLLPWLLQLEGINAALCVANLALAVTGFVRGWHPSARPIQTVTFGFILAWLTVAPIYQLANGRAAWRDNDVLASGTDVTVALMLITAANGALLWGFTRTRAPRIIDDDVVALVRPYVPWIYLIACSVLTPPAIVATGGLRAMFSSRSERGTAYASQGLTLERVGGLQYALIGILPAALALVSAYLFLISALAIMRARGFLAVPVSQASALIVALALVALHDNPFIRSRFVAAGAAGALLLLVLRPRSRRAGRILAGVTVLVTLVVYPLANLFRGNNFRLKTGVEVYASADFDGFQQVINAVSLARDTGYTFGYYTSSALLYFVPRSIWPGKAVPASIDVAEHRGYAFTNLSLPFPAELFLEFTAVGMVVLLFVLASRLGRMDTRWLHNPESRDALLVPYMALAMLGVFRGPMGSNGPVYFTIIGLLWLGIRRVPQKSEISEPPTTKT